MHLYRVWDRDYPRIQILTIRELLEDGRLPLLPPLVLPTFRQAPRERKVAAQGELDWAELDDA